MSLTLRYAARSDRGLIREGNEDSVYAGPRLLAVADGMGGMAAGEIASNIVIGALAPLDEDVSSDDLVDALRNAIDHANRQLREAVESDPSLEGMGTTLTAMLFSGNRLALVNIGDSRAYVFRNGELTQITRDDTYVQMLVDEGRITEDEATTHPQRSLLTRALDGRDVEPDFSVREARIGDRYLLCSDGLSGVVSPETIAEALSAPDHRTAADRLIQLALRGGGPDNITCIVADVVSNEQGSAAPEVGGAAARDRTTVAGADTAAGRAALANPRPAPEPEDEPDSDDAEPVPPPRRRVRAVVLTLLVLALLAAGGSAGWAYTQRQYYVGATDDGSVAIYRGVAGSIAGIEFSSLESTTELDLDDLNPVARKDVRQTIPAGDVREARQIVRRLHDQQLPLCPPGSPSPGASPPDSATPSTGPTPRRADPPRGTTRTPPVAGGPGVPRTTPGGPVTGSIGPGASASVEPLPSESPEPTVNCREPK